MSSEYYWRIIEGRGDHQSMWPWALYEHRPSRGSLGTVDTWPADPGPACWISALPKGRKSLWMEMTAKQVESSTSQSHHSLGLNKHQSWEMSLCSLQFRDSGLIEWAALTSLAFFSHSPQPLSFPFPCPSDLFSLTVHPPILCRALW